MALRRSRRSTRKAEGIGILERKVSKSANHIPDFGLTISDRPYTRKASFHYLLPTCYPLPYLSLVL